MMEESPKISADEVSTIDLSLLRHNPLAKSSLILKIRHACRRFGFFHVVNHGVADSVIEEALDANLRFFEMGMAAREELLSDDIFKAVRFGKVQIGDFSRDFLKLYAYPLHQFVSCWPRLPPDYREKMGTYTTQVRKLSIELFGAILESLDIHTPLLVQNFEKGFQILGVNCYPRSSGSDGLKTGLPPHTDHTIITILLQSAPGLEVADGPDGQSWKSVPDVKGSLQVFVGDHLEVISNGLYKSVLHRAIPVFCGEMRLSLASLHNLEMDEMVEVAAELVSEENPRMYGGSCLRDFLKHHASGDKRTFLQTLKIGNQS